MYTPGMGLDAPSSDLTERIRARRKAGVAAGEIEPARPGEHVVHGTRAGVDVERMLAGAEARERRAARAGAAEEVVEFVYTDEERAALEDDAALRLSPEDGGDTAIEEPPLPDEEPLALETQEDALEEIPLLPEPDEAVEGPDPVYLTALTGELVLGMEEQAKRQEATVEMIAGLGDALILLAAAFDETTRGLDTLAALLQRPSRWSRLRAWLRL